MDWSDTPEQAAFRTQVRSFIEEHLPDYYRKNYGQGHHVGPFSENFGGDRKSDDPVRRGSADSWARSLADQRWVAPHWPHEYGGAGMTAMEQFIFKQEMAAAGAPAVGGGGVQMLGPAMLVHGSEDQKREYLPKILSGEVGWAQGFSEPGAGSDLGSLQTRAARDGDEYVVNGQKIWTSGAHDADWIFMLARTDPDAPKHRGISMLLFDIHTPGVSVRPLISAGWQHDLNETFFEDVRVPAGQILGEENRGWYVAMTLLDFERSNIAGAVEARKELDEVLDYVKSTAGRDVVQDRLDLTRHELAQRYIESEVLFNFSFRIISMQHQGMVPNTEASVSKIFGADLAQSVPRSVMKAFGPYANIWDREDVYAPLAASFTQLYVHTIPRSIMGGSSEIQRGVIATRGLGLPRG
jgi:alkylation response protein AidB-like acyl-CoA dehydrogenase